MAKTVHLLGLMLVITPASAFAQATGSRDGTDEVRSQSLGVPGQSTNPADQLVQRQALQDLDRGGQKNAGKVGSARPARANELTAGAVVNDKAGSAMAKIESIDPDGIVVSLGTAKVKVPADAFGHNKAGLLLDMTKAQFEQMVAKANTAS